MNDLQTYDELIFENIKRIDEHGNEFWYARELQTALEYSKWQNFENVIDRAKIACKTSGNLIDSNFTDVSKTATLTFGEREINDIALSRYACYLIVQNGDPRKEIIALGQSYFALKTREQEVQDQFNKLSENNKRLAIREEIKKHNKSLFEAAKNAGVENYGRFYNHGYMGLYGGLDVDGIRDVKGLKKSEGVLDYMGSTELAANLFRATQTDEKLRREPITGEQNANITHYDVGKAVRTTMIGLGNKPPEKLPTPKESIQEIKSKNIQHNDDQLNLF